MVGQDNHPCSVCGESRGEAFRCFFNGYGGLIKLWRCRICGYVAQNLGPGRWTPPDDLAGGAVKGFLGSGDRWMYPHRRRALMDIRRRISKVCPSGRLLDVGGGDGQFLHLCKQADFSCLGIEPNASLAEHATNASGVEVTAGRYEAGSFTADSFDIITFIQVLEHLPNPGEALGAAREHLRPGGLLVIEVPSIRSPHWVAWRVTRCGRVLENRFGVFPEHVGYYSPKSLTELTRRAGFRRISLVTGRWRFKYGGLLRTVAYALDPLLNRLGVGGILYMGINT